tara:strand:+ start:38 stop:439 length:402 start_codon:yes stop_codon:yes gene_type:complete
MIKTIEKFMNPKEVLYDFCVKNIKNKNNFLVDIESNNLTSQAYLLGFYALYGRIYNPETKDVKDDVEALAEFFEVKQNRIKDILIKATKKTFEVPYDENDNTLPKALANGKSDFQLYYMQNVDSKINWDNYPD